MLPDFQALFESLPEIFLVVSMDDPVFTAVAASDAYLKAAGMSRESLVGRGLFDVAADAPTPVHAAMVEDAAASFRRVIATRLPDRMMIHQSSPTDEGVAGARRWQRVNSPAPDRDGSPRFIVCRLEELTEAAAHQMAQHEGEAEKAAVHLRQQWNTFDIALSNTPDFTYIFGLDGRFQYVNRALLSLWQKTLGEALGKNFFELGYPPELAGRLQRQIDRVVETRQSVRDQTPFTGPDGETRSYEYIFVPVFASDGRVEAVAGSTRDITERIKVEEAIEQDRRRWRDLLSQVPAAIAVLRGPDHTFQWINADYRRLIGRSAEAIVGKTVLEAVPEVEGQIYVNLLNGVYQTGKAFLGRESLLRLDQGDGIIKDIYVDFVYLPTKDDRGAIDGVFVHITDVTGMVLSRQRIEESERQFRTLAETIPHLAWMADEKGEIFWYNQRWYDYTGGTFEEMKGWAWQKVHDPAVLPTVLANWKAAIESGEPIAMVFPLKGANGEFRSFLTRVEPVRDNQGRVSRWFGTNTDITDQLKTEEELRKTNRELEEFAYVASHDLQEPLRMVNVYTQLILRDIGVAGPKLESYAGFVEQGIHRMQSLIQDLLTFSRAVHAEDLPVGTADLTASLHEALSVLKNRIEESGAVITAEPLPTVRGDTSQLGHVFQNLLTNALKYRKMDVAPQIHISSRPDGNHWIVSVRDDGIGFDQQYAKRIFGLFKRLHKDEYPGTGLGLAICKRIVERYGGRIWAEGKAGEGATFEFSLRRVEAE